MNFQSLPVKEQESIGHLTVKSTVNTQQIGTGIKPDVVAAVSSDAKEKKTVDEKAILKVINQGGAPALSAIQEQTEIIRNINLVLPDSTVKAINKIRERYPKKAGKKIAISQKEWIAQAVNEKLERDRIQYSA